MEKDTVTYLKKYVADTKTDIRDEEDQDVIDEGKQLIEVIELALTTNMVNEDQSKIAKIVLNNKICQIAECFSDMDLDDKIDDCGYSFELAYHIREALREIWRLRNQK